MIKSKEKEELSRPGIYLLTNKTNGLIYVGKSNNIYNRWCQYRSIIKGHLPNKNYNNRLINHLQRFDFKFEVLEFTELDDNILSEKEIYWILEKKSNDKNLGYNLSLNSETKTIVSEDTKQKIKERVTQEWKDGIRRKHGEKLANSWKNRDREEQAHLFSQILTKYKYIVTFPDNTVQEVNYQGLKKLNLHNIIANFQRKKTNTHIRKDGIKIERICIEDIVQPSVKIEE